MSKPQQLVHKKKIIFYMDFSNLNNKSEIKNLIDESIRHIRSQPALSLLTLTNIEGMHFNSEIRDLFNDFIKGNKPFVKAGAVVGLAGLQQIVYNSLMKVTGRDIKAFSNPDEAKDWLALRD
jgi:hypothetical protein